MSSTRNPRSSVDRREPDSGSFIIVIVFVAAEKYEINRCLVAARWLTATITGNDGSTPLTGLEFDFRMATHLGAVVVRPAASAMDSGSSACSTGSSLSLSRSRAARKPGAD